MIPACFALIAVAFAIALPMTWLVRRAANRLGQFDRPGERKIHDRPIPSTGGVAIFAGFILPMLLGLLAVWAAPEAWWQRLLPDLVGQLPGIRAVTGTAMAFIAAVTALHVVGLIDDRFDLAPIKKLLVQVAAAGLLAVLFDVRLMEWAGAVPSIMLTVLWLVAITNAFNFLDNMDGLSGGVATICAGIFFAAALIGGQWFVAAVLALLIGSLLGFLVFNFPPATIFMGDGGSLLVGFVLAFCSVRVTYFDPDLTRTAWYAVFTPLVVLAIPLYDLTSVTLIRIAQGKSPLKGDTQHFSHRLVRKGLSRPAAVIVIYACTFATGLGGVMLGRVAGWQAALIVAQTLAILLVLALLERTAITNHDV